MINIDKTQKNALCFLYVSNFIVAITNTRLKSYKNTI